MGSAHTKSIIYRSCGILRNQRLSYYDKDSHHHMRDLVCGINRMLWMSVLYNVSFVILKRLLKELNIIFIVILALCNWAIDIGMPYRPESPVLGLCIGSHSNLHTYRCRDYEKSIFCTVWRYCICCHNPYHAHYYTFGDDDDIALFHYTIGGERYAFMRRSTKRSIFLQILFFSWNGIYTMLVDKSMKLMMFATGPFVQTRRGSTTRARRCHDGKTSEIRAIRVSPAVFCHIVMLHLAQGYGFRRPSSHDNCVWWNSDDMFRFLFYNNISVVMAKRLLIEPNVAITIVLGICNCAINISKPENEGSPALGFVYMMLISSFVFLDSMITKSRQHSTLRWFDICGMQSVFDLPANTWEYGQRHRSIQIYRSRQVYKIMKRSTKRLIYLQILLLGANGIYTIMDKPMKLMMFATGPIYKSSGTASEKNKDESYSSASDRERITRKQRGKEGPGQWFAKEIVPCRHAIPATEKDCIIYPLFFLLY